MLLAAVVAIVIGAARPAAAVMDACADADGDGAVTVTDGVQTLRAAIGLPSPCTLERCDVDGSGAVTVTDGVGVLSRAAELPAVRFYECPIPQEAQNFSGFEHFALRRLPALGFCPAFGSVLSVDLDRRADGTYRAQFTVAEERPFDDAGCLAAFVWGNETCVAEISRPDRVLTAFEGDRLREAFTAIPTYEARDPTCAIMAYDPCVIDRLTWDESSYDDYPCSSSRVGYDVVDAITEMLDGVLVAADPPAR